MKGKSVMFQYPLMRNNFSREDLDAVVEYLQQDDPILTNGSIVKHLKKNGVTGLDQNIQYL